jgi:hypothetical protein
METHSEPRIPEEWETIIRNIPIVSVNLVVRTHDGVVDHFAPGDV